MQIDMAIMRIFVRPREVPATHKDLAGKVEEYTVTTFSFGISLSRVVSGAIDHNGGQAGSDANRARQ